MDYKSTRSCTFTKDSGLRREKIPGKISLRNTFEIVRLVETGIQATQKT
jgi:hypothetical protein